MYRKFISTSIAILLFINIFILLSCAQSVNPAQVSAKNTTDVGNSNDENYTKYIIDPNPPYTTKADVIKELDITISDLLNGPNEHGIYDSGGGSYKVFTEDGFSDYQCAVFDYGCAVGYYLAMNGAPDTNGWKKMLSAKPDYATDGLLDLLEYKQFNRLTNVTGLAPIDPAVFYMWWNDPAYIVKGEGSYHIYTNCPDLVGKTYSTVTGGDAYELGRQECTSCLDQFMNQKSE